MLTFKQLHWVFVQATPRRHGQRNLVSHVRVRLFSYCWHAMHALYGGVCSRFVPIMSRSEIFGLHWRHARSQLETTCHPTGEAINTSFSPATHIAIGSAWMLLSRETGRFCQVLVRKKYGNAMRKKSIVGCLPTQSVKKGSRARFGMLEGYGSHAFEKWKGHYTVAIY